MLKVLRVPTLWQCTLCLSTSLRIQVSTCLFTLFTVTKRIDLWSYCTMIFDVSECLLDMIYLVAFFIAKTSSASTMILLINVLINNCRRRYISSPNASRLALLPIPTGRQNCVCLDCNGTRAPLKRLSGCRAWFTPWQAA